MPSAGDIILGLALVIVAGVMNGSWNASFNDRYGYAVKRKGIDSKPDLEYHLAWVLFQIYASIINTIICIYWAGGPARVAFIIKEASTTDIILVNVFAVLWGIGSVGFGLACRVAGVGLGTNLVMGLIVIIGAFLPLLLEGILISATGALIVSGIAICCVGLYFVVGSLQSRDTDDRLALAVERSTRSGFDALPDDEKLASEISTVQKLTICVVTAIFGSMPQFMFVFGEGIIDIAESNEGPGSTTTSGSAAIIWMFAVVLGAPASIIYGLYQNPASIPWTRVFECPWYRHVLIIVTTSLPWISHIHLYGISASLLPEEVGASVAFPVLMVITVLTGLCWSLRLGEWLNASRRSLKQLRSGIIYLSIGVICMMTSVAVR